MNRKSAGLLAFCILLAGIAFAVLFVAPRYADEAAVQEAATKTDRPGEPGQQAAIDPAIGGGAAPGESDDATAAAPEDDGQPVDETAAPDPDEPATVPAFDILRVEPDGSTVIAGRAAPGDTLEIMNGDEVIASVEVGPEGDFAAVFDEPLPPGDYQLSLRATGEGDRVVMSDEIATISVPRDGSGQLLAMVTKPGEASRIITQPEVAATGDDAPGDTASLPGAVAALENGRASDAPGSATPRATADGQQDIAAVDPSTPQPETTQPSSNQPAAPDPVRIDAVEIEGSQLYVTGSAADGTTIEIYADDKLVGSASTDNGRFLVEAEMPLSVGDHVIRADMLRDGQVVARATVPFNRPEGAAIAAIAPPAGAAAPAAANDDAPAETTETGDMAVAPGNATGGATFAPAGEATTGQTTTGQTNTGQATTGQATTSGATGDAPAAGGPVIVQQAALTPTAGSVIIRRGDTLWQISRRVYGQGVRYTTIYLANETTISNPDRILPGQVFSVPDKALDNAEELHRQRLGR